MKQSYVKESDQVNMKIMHFDFHPVYDNQILISKRNILGIMQYDQDKSLFFKNSSFGEFNNIVQAKFYRNGE